MFDFLRSQYIPIHTWLELSLVPHRFYKNAQNLEMTGGGKSRTGALGGQGEQTREGESSLLDLTPSPAAQPATHLTTFTCFQDPVTKYYHTATSISLQH